MSGVNSIINICDQIFLSNLFYLIYMVKFLSLVEKYVHIMPYVKVFV